VETQSLLPLTPGGNMSIQTIRFRRRTFYVEAVQVTAENMEEVAAWCNGKILSTFVKSRKESVSYIKVHVMNPTSDRQTKAFVGDWVLPYGQTFKIYTERSMDQTFEKAEVDILKEEMSSVMNSILDGDSKRQKLVDAIENESHANELIQEYMQGVVDNLVREKLIGAIDKTKTVQKITDIFMGTEDRSEIMPARRKDLV
jgi:hypothetical protein